MEIVSGVNDILEAAGLPRNVISLDHMIHTLPTLMVMLYNSFFDVKPRGNFVLNPSTTFEEFQNVESILTTLQIYHINFISARSLIAGDLEALKGFVELFSLVSKSVPKPKSMIPILSSRNEITELKLILAKVNHLEERLNHEMARAEGYFQLRSDALKLKFNEAERIQSEIAQQSEAKVSDKEPMNPTSPYKAIPHLQPPERKKKKTKKKTKEAEPKRPPESPHLETNQPQRLHEQSIVPSRPSSSAPSRRKPLTRRVLTATQPHPPDEALVSIQRPSSAPNQKPSPRRDHQRKRSLNQDASQQEGNLEKARGLQKPPKDSVLKTDEVAILTPIITLKSCNLSSAVGVHIQQMDRKKGSQIRI
jgi:hypothetical protein